MYINKLADIDNECNKGYHRTIKVNPDDIKSSTYINFGMDSNEKDLKYKVGDYVRISKYKTFLQKVTLQIDLKKFLC